MKHRLLAAALGVICFLLLPLPALAESASAPVVVSDAAGLLAMAQRPDGDYMLGADIDMSGVDWTPFAFDGTLDGAGHTVYNLRITRACEETRITYDGRHRGYHTVFAAPFSVVSGSVQNLNLLNVTVDLDMDDPCFIAGVAGYLLGGEIVNCSVQGRLKISSGARQCGAGGVAGFGHGRIEGCAVDAEIVIVAVDSGSTCEEYLGGVLANGYADVENCSVTLKGFTSVRGYVHNGGLVGLSDVNPKNKRYFEHVRGCSVDAVISFFEDVEDRRAYCRVYVGEIQNGNLVVTGNETVRFESVESTDFSRLLLPDMDEIPSYDAAVTPPHCDAFGYSTYTNPDTGYSYTDDYTAPAHTPGEWQVVVPATYDSEGLRRQYCAECGVLLAEEAIPPLIPTASCELSEAKLRLSYRETRRLRASVLPIDATNTNVTWMSSNESVATVDNEGLVSAIGKGVAAIYCKTDDGFASAACEVEVYFTFGQWLTRYVLFGWIWQQ
ncbi:MAG: hypothetical protein GX417_06435 [Clostridiales bacterium]|nr:hypothetical protein [Clostridiales bacterium]